jgi:hypothetical protein
VGLPGLLTSSRSELDFGPLGIRSWKRKGSWKHAQLVLQRIQLVSWIFSFHILKTKLTTYVGSVCWCIQHGIQQEPWNSPVSEPELDLSLALSHSGNDRKKQISRPAPTTGLDAAARRVWNAIGWSHDHFISISLIN